MSYQIHNEWTSPNSTPGSQVAATWGRPRTIEAIAIHWWGDPNTNPSFMGVINGFLKPGGVSAHFVATGTNRQVAQLVDFGDASWATNSANPYTISIECDPRCRDQDYDVVAEVISQIWDAYGYLPLVPHRQFVATACPGNYDLGRLERLAKTKDGSGDWGDVHDKEVTPPTPPAGDNLYKVVVNGTQVGAYTYDDNAYQKWVATGSSGRIVLNGRDVTDEVVAKFATTTTTTLPPSTTTTTLAPSTTTTSTTAQPQPPTPPDGLTTLWEDFLAWLKKYVMPFLSKYKRG